MLSQDQITLTLKMHLYGLKAKKIVSLDKTSISKVSQLTNKRNYIPFDEEKKKLIEEIDKIFQNSKLVSLPYFVHKWAELLNRNFPDWDVKEEDINYVNLINFLKSLEYKYFISSSAIVKKAQKIDEDSLKFYSIGNCGRYIFLINEKNRNYYNTLFKFEEYLISENPTDIDLQQYIKKWNNDVQNNDNKINEIPMQFKFLMTQLYGYELNANNRYIKSQQQTQNDLPNTSAQNIIPSKRSAEENHQKNKRQKSNNEENISFEITPEDWDILSRPLSPKQFEELKKLFDESKSDNASILPLPPTFTKTSDPSAQLLDFLQRCNNTNQNESNKPYWIPKLN